MQNMKNIEWIECLNQRFEARVGKLHLQPEEIIEHIKTVLQKKKFNQLVKDQISNNLTILNMH